MMAELPIHILGGFVVISVNSEKELDNEWVELIREALELGISVDEIRDFLNK
jgi:hypothetical protein